MGRQILNLAVFVVLARLLAPADFGVVALATVFVALAQVVVDQGLGDALIQRRRLGRRHVDTAFWAAVAMGTFLTAVAIVLAGPLSDVLREPGLEPVLMVLSLSFVLASFTSIQIALLRRELAFRSLAIRALVASAGGGLAGIVVAVMGGGAWALVAQQLVSATASVFVLWAVTPWRPTLSFSTADFRELFPFGLNIMGSDVLTFLSRNGDNFLIGAVLGTTPLGFYAVGYRLLEVTQVLLVNVARKITFPAFSRLQHDPERLRRAYLRVTRASAAIILPGYIGMALVASELVPTVFGMRWEPSSDVATILFLIGPVLSVQAFSGSFLNAIGRPDVTLRFRLITTVANLVGFALAVPFGITAVAAAFVARGYLLLPVNLAWMQRDGGVEWRSYLRELVGPLGATAAMAAVVVLTKVVLGRSLDAPAVLAIEVALGAGTFGLVLFVFDRATTEELARLTSQAFGRRQGGQHAGHNDSVD